jgi:hypothetical protein
MSDYAGRIDFPWGDPDPPDGYKVGDTVGIIHSDHETYMFDNPVGTIVAIENDSDDPEDTVYTVAVNAGCVAKDLYLVARATEGTPA